jgi:hypothetical protein
MCSLVSSEGLLGVIFTGKAKAGVPGGIGMKRVVVAAGVVVLALAGCASLRPVPEEALERSAAGEPSRTCRVEQETGSHIPREVCRTEAEDDQDREKAEEMLVRGIQRGVIVIP